MPIKSSGDAPASTSTDAKAKDAREAGVVGDAKQRTTSPAVTDEPKADFPPEFQAFFKASASLITFEYTAEQWMEIAKTIQHFLAEPEVYKKALWKLQNSARSFFLETLNRPGRKQQGKWRLSHWKKVEKLANALMSEFFWLARDERSYGPPTPSEVKPYNEDKTGEERKPYNEDLLALMKISMMAKSHVVNLGGRIDDGFPKITPKAAYQSSVLDVWTDLGGKLRFSRHPSTGKIQGPLARYFSAVTQPVHGGSPESLPDIIERHLAWKEALAKWRLDMAIANVQP